MEPLAWSKGATSHFAASAWRKQQWQAGVAKGDMVPFSLPLFALGWILLLAHLAYPRKQAFGTRALTFSLITAFNFWCFAYLRSYSSATGVAIGMLGSWNIMWAAVLLVFQDAKRDFRRIVRRPAAPSHPHGTARHAAKQGEYQWQSFDDAAGEGLWARLAWSADLVTTFRGIGWNWKVAGMPSRPPAVEASLQHMELKKAAEEDRPQSRTGRGRPATTRRVLVGHLGQLVTAYLLLDALKVAINHDAFFWGLDDEGPLPGWMARVPVIGEHGVLLWTYRYGVGFLFLYAGLSMLFALAGLFCAGVLGTRVLGVGAEPWMYPEQFGAYSAVLQRGLAGFWGGWWHQIFRYGFTACGQFLTRRVLRLPGQSPVAGLVQLCVSFYLSGLMHAAMSIAMVGSTQPWRRMFWFFALQPLGVVLGLAWLELLRVTRVRAMLPRAVVSLSNVVNTHAWLYLTMGLLVDDLIRGGMMLYEPVPLSPLRALGLGVAGDGLYCWRETPLAWHLDAAKWWQSGLRV